MTDHAADVARPQATFRIWRGDRRAAAARSTTITTDVSTEGMVVLDAVHQIQAEQANDLAVRLELQGGQVRLVLGGDQRQAAADVHDAAEHLPLDQPVTRRADARVPADQRPGDGRVVELRGQEARSSRSSRGQPDAPDGTWRMAQADVDRVQEFRKCIECFLCQDVCHVLRDHHDARRVHRAALPRLRAPRSRCTRSTPTTALADLKEHARHRLLQHHQVLHEGLSRAHHDHRQRDHPAEGARRRPVLRSDQRLLRVLRELIAAVQRRQERPCSSSSRSRRTPSRPRSRRPSATGC